MKVRTNCFLAAMLLLCSMASAADPVPVTITAEVVNIPSGREAKRVIVETTVNEDELVQNVVVRGDQYITIALSDTKAVGQALAAMAKSMNIGDEQKVGGMQIRVGKFDDGKKYVSLSKLQSFSSGEYMDAKTAKQMAEGLVKAEEVAAWVKQRAAAFQK